MPASGGPLRSPVHPYDAVLLVSFGGPEGPDDVVPFLRNVTAGRGIPDERLAEVGEHYALFGGKSPINDQNRALLAALRADFDARGLEVPIYWGNRNWDPYLVDAITEMERDGIRRALCLVTSAYSSYSGCRQYREDLTAARAQVVADLGHAPVLDRTRVYFNHPGFVEANTAAVLAALEGLPAEVRDGARLVFVTHSIPVSMAEASGPGGAGAYEAQHRAVADLVVAGVAAATGEQHEADLVFCSRSGPPQVPWLEPDVNDHLESLAGGADPTAVVLVPIGFVSDHMEVIYDLDTEAQASADRLGVPCVRAATAGVDPRFVAMVGDLLLDRAASERGEQPERPTLGDVPAAWDRCALDCCLNPRSTRAAVVGSA